MLELSEKIHSCLIKGGYFEGSVFNNCSNVESEFITNVQYAKILDDAKPDSIKEITARVDLGVWMASPSMIHSLLKNSFFNIDYFSVDETVIEFISRK